MKSALKLIVPSCLLFLLTAVLAQTVWAQAEPGTEWEKTVQAAKKEGQVVLYGSSDFELLFKEFQRKYPEIQVSGFFGRGRGVIRRAMGERRAGQYLADLYLNGMTSGYNVLYKAKAVEPIKPALLLPEVTDPSKWWRGRLRYVDPEGMYLLVFNGQSRVDVAYNTKLVDAATIRSYWDLLDPKWKGKIVSFDPMHGAAGTTMRFIYYNPKLGREFLERLFTETDVTISRDSRQMGDWLAGGRYAFAVLNGISRMDLGKARDQGLPVFWFGPKDLEEGAAITAASGGVAIFKQAPHPNAARVAVNWLLSREGQIAYQRIFSSKEEGPDSLRIDIPKEDVPALSRRVDGSEERFPQTDNAEWMDMKPIRTFMKGVLKKK